MELTTRIATTEDEYRALKSMLSARYREAFGVHVAPASLHVITCLGSKIVATIGIETAIEGRLPLERFFTIRDERLDVRRGTMLVEFTRWVSNYPLAGAHAVLGAATAVLDGGGRHVVFSMKAKQLQYLTRLRLPFDTLNAEISHDIPPALRPYYAGAPLPSVIMADAEAIQATFRKAVRVPVAAHA